MPGVSSRQPVAGADGFGKVHFKFMPKPPPRGHRVLGFFVYGIFFTTLILSFGWSRPYLKYNYVVPGMRRLLSLVETIQGQLSGLPEERASKSSQFNDITEIQAKTIQGAIFDQGYMHAMDRWMQMEIFRKTALGTLSEFYGNATVESDKFYRTLNIRDIAQSDLKAFDETQALHLTSYSAGVNAYLSAAAKGDYGGTLPLDFELLLGRGKYTAVPWEPVHTLAVLRLLAYQWSHGWEDQLLSILASKSAHVAESSLWFTRHSDGADSSVGSSVPSLGGVSVAISGSRSANKAALLANSFTSSASYAGLWYFNALNVPHALRVSGASVPGVPFVFIGRNRHISWGISRAAHISTEKLVFMPTVGFEGDVNVREESITVRGLAEPLVHTARDTVHGPVVSDHLTGMLTGSIAQLDLGWHSFALASDALSQPLSLSFLHQINTATDFSEFASGVEELTAMALNFVYADGSGNIGSVASGRIVAAAADTLAQIAEPTASDATLEVTTEPEQLLGDAATEIVAVDEVPCVPAVPEAVPEVRNNRVFNPASGIIVAAGSAGGPSASSEAQRICQRLNCASPAATLKAADLRKLLVDTFSPSSLVLRDIVLQVSVNATQSEVEKAEILAMQALVDGFDGVYTTAAAAPVLLEAFRVALVQRVLKPVAGIAGSAADAPMYPVHRVKSQSIRSEIQWIYNALLKPDTTCQPSSAADPAASPVCAFRSAWWRSKRVKPEELVLDALRDAVEWCKGTYGADPAQWTWGQAHVAQYAHPNPKWFPIVDELLTRGPAGMSGTLDSLQHSDYVASSGLLTTDVLHHAENMAATSLRVVFDMSNKRCYRAMTPSTQSLRLGSPLAGAVQQLTRWSHSDTAESYDELCWRNEVRHKADKEEL